MNKGARTPLIRSIGAGASLAAMLAASAAVAAEPDTGTRGIPITPADIDLADIDGLGAADRLGLGRRDDDEVGPTA